MFLYHHHHISTCMCVGFCNSFITIVKKRRDVFKLFACVFVLSAHLFWLFSFQKWFLVFFGAHNRHDFSLLFFKSNATFAAPSADFTVLNCNCIKPMGSFIRNSFLQCVKLAEVSIIGGGGGGNNIYFFLITSCFKFIVRRYTINNCCCCCCCCYLFIVCYSHNGPNGRRQIYHSYHPAVHKQIEKLNEGG